MIHVRGLFWPYRNGGRGDARFYLGLLDESGTEIVAPCYERQRIERDDFVGEVSFAQAVSAWPTVAAAAVFDAPTGGKPVSIARLRPMRILSGDRAVVTLRSPLARYDRGWR